MALTAYPFDSQDITEAQYGALFGAIALSGVVGSPASNHFKVTAAGSSMVVSVTSVGAESFAVLRGHAVLMTASENSTVSAASAGARVDRVVLRLDYAANTIAPAIKAGTSGSPTPPAVTWGVGGIYEISLALIAVGAGVTTINNGNITDDRQFAGRTVGAWSTATRPSTGPVMGYNVTLGLWEATPDGSAWSPLASDWATLSGRPSSFPPSAHALDSAAHTGVLPIAMGGTGASTAIAALNALGIYPQATQPATPPDGVLRIWIKTA